MRVLVIEDHPDLAQLLKEQLTYEGFEVRTVTEGFEALLAPEPWEGVDAAIVDYWLRRDGYFPDEPEGFPILCYLRDHQPHIRRVVYSAIGRDSLPSSLAHVVLTKPAHVAELVEAING